MKSIINGLSCPACRESLRDSTNAKACPSCNTSFPIVDGILDVRKNQSAYYCEFPKEDIESFLQSAASDMEGTVRQYLRDRAAPPRLGEYMLGHGRAGWKFLLPLTKDSRVLDLGCGWGTLAYGLAERVKEVVAMDSTMERMRLLALRSKQDGRDQIKVVCGGDGRFLPFADDSFDVVVVNGVLEWVPSGMEGHPGQLQEAFLSEIRRVLKDDGCLFLGIENRFAWKTWFRNRDGHTDLRFVPWLPRPLADLYSRMMGKGGYRNWLYSRRQYVNLLRDKGFNDVQFHIPLPGYHHPIWMVPAGRKTQIADTVRRRVSGGLNQLKQRLKGRLSAEFPDSFAMVAQVTQKQPVFLERLLQQLASEHDNIQATEIDDTHYRVNAEMGMVTILVPRKTRGVVLKLPLHNHAKQCLEHEISLLRGYTEELMGLLPKVVSQNLFETQDYAVFSFLPGICGDQRFAEGEPLDDTLSSAGELLKRLNGLGKPANGPMMISALGGKVLSLAANPAQQDSVKSAMSVVADQLDQLCAQGWALGHGDFKLANTIFDSAGKLVGVIDWGGWVPSELPGYDLAFMLTDCRWKLGGSIEVVFA